MRTGNVFRTRSSKIATNACAAAAGDNRERGRLVRSSNDHDVDLVGAGVGAIRF
jgi:hypothetical protein